jgi:cyclopropane fatty-acyl-phospholipid synthase-like methyltransferase
VTDDDVPSPIDLRTMTDARAWERTAMEMRPWRADVFARIGDELARRGVRRILELGSGPGFLAAHLLGRLDIAYVALDSSDAMHALARARLGALADRVTFATRDFREPTWPDDLGTFDAVVTMQAVHELRHKRRAPGLHAQVRGVLEPGGAYLVCDHIAGVPPTTNTSLYMTELEHLDALRSGGFAGVQQLARVHGLALFEATHGAIA